MFWSLRALYARAKLDEVVYNELLFDKGIHTPVWCLRLSVLIFDATVIYRHDIMFLLGSRSSPNEFILHTAIYLSARLFWIGSQSNLLNSKNETDSIIWIYLIGGIRKISSLHGHSGFFFARFIFR